jgi:histidine triad (HIT) family protein
MADCVFCKIVAGVIPSEKVYEDSSALAFMDINPVTRGHVLLIPKRHSTDITQMTEEEAAAVARVLRKVAGAAKAAAGAEGFNILNNAGRVAGQAVEHVHFHIIPRTTGDGRGYRWLTLDFPQAEIAALAKDIAGRMK